MKNRINAFFTAEEIRLEDFDNEIWRQAEFVEINRYWSGEPAPAERCASARILWSENRLFVRFDCRQAEPFVINRNPNLDAEAAELWERDVCEIFIAPDLNVPEKYFEFEIAPTGEWLDFAIRQLPEKRETDKTYNAGMKTAARIGENSFTVVFTVEFERSFGRKPKAGEVWRTNLFRCIGSGETRGYLAWQPTFTETPSFHVPTVFGSLKFTK
ncbi:MAG TPA: carbohydrate-binding family 9-like protein [Pyrinomonadaceae bacterium]|nr:carbohydrate-binding family 9-like protein [Pyrinomonadaceae bacterium]